MRTQYVSLLTIYLILTLSGCSTAANVFTPLGENKYDCNRKENPNSPYCHSFRSVEQATGKDVPNTRYDEVMNISKSDELKGIAPDNKATPINTNRPQQGSASSITLGESTALPVGTPVRVAPIIQRVWIKSFTDKNDMLTSDQVVYKEVVPTHWAGQDVNPIRNKAGGFTGAYPHRPLVAPAIAPVLQNADTNTAQQETKPEQTDFIQPGTKSAGEDTGKALPAFNATNLPQ
jgi:conjugal transfer pilus assembly protein TraV